jgi:thiosulfate dehydrogenase [quinone] large subunit
MRLFQFIRENRAATYILTGIRLYLGWQWMMTGWEKIGGSFDASGFLKGALAKTGGEHPAVQSWWATFLKQIALPHVEWFNVLVPWGEFLVGISLILGVCTTFSVVTAVILNFSYLLSGAVSTNPQMILLEFILLVAAFNAGKIGLDRWFIPFIRHLRQRLESKQNSTIST